MPMNQFVRLEFEVRTITRRIDESELFRFRKKRLNIGTWGLTALMTLLVAQPVWAIGDGGAGGDGQGGAYGLGGSGYTGNSGSDGESDPAGGGGGGGGSAGGGLGGKGGSA